MIARIQFYIFLLSAISGGLLYWKKDLQQKAFLQYNQMQLEQAAKDREEFTKKMSEIQDKQRTVEEDLAKQNENVNQKLSNIDTYLTSPDATKNDKASSDILKNTVTQLGGDKR
jgi:septal ring factor EnvC (AmiA/AmiB activator)